jgi:hypothetical protein
MKRFINCSLLETKTAEQRLTVLGIVTGILGGTVLVFSLCLLGLDLFYQLSGASRLVAAEVITDLLTLVRCLAFIVLPLLGVAFVVIAHGIWQYGVKENRCRASASHIPL